LTETLAIHAYLNSLLSSGQTEKGNTGEEQSQEHAHHFFDDVSSGGSTALATHDSNQLHI
jgi:hypothetical protein